MPLREYICEACNKKFERLEYSNEPPLTECPICEKPVQKLISAAAFHFKGTGFYSTDYKKKP